MKNLALFVLAMLCCSVYSCKKKDADSGITTKITADFRDTYTGDFRLYCTAIYVVHRSDMGAQRDSTVTNYTSDITVSYAVSDSIEVLSPVATEAGKYPAITLTYSNGDKVQYGIEANGHMIRQYQSHAWFITADSLVISSGTYATNYTSIYEAEGKRK